MLLLIQASNIKIFENNNSPGILPFKLGTANLVTSKHIFLYDVNLNILGTEIKNLNKIYFHFNSSLNLEKNSYFSNLIINYEHLYQVIFEINQKFENIQFGQTSKIRQKRGLINAGGTLQKWIFGTLDATDGERYENILRNLKENQEKIVKQTNAQISLSKALVDKYSKGIDKIALNQQKISDYVANFSQRLENFSDELYRYMGSSTMINRIFINAYSILSFLNTLENAITFSKLHVTHPDILSHENLKQILHELKNYYTSNQILKINNFSWFSIIHTNCYYSENGILFVLEIPIVYPKPFQYFHLFPFPTKQNTIIVPKQPYLALEDETYQYMDQPCIKIEENYICDHENFQTDPSTDCIASLVQDKKSFCLHTPIEPPSLILNKINDEYLIIISKDTIKVKTYCPDREYHLIKGNVLIQLPENCSISYKDYTFSSKKTSKFEKPIILLNTEDLSLINEKHSSSKLLHIDGIPLEEIHHLQKQIKAINPVSIAEVDDRVPNTWSLWTPIGVILALVILYGIYQHKILRTNRSSSKTVATTKEERKPPSVLFQPEVVS